MVLRIVARLHSGHEECTLWLETELVALELFETYVSGIRANTALNVRFVGVGPVVERVRLRAHGQHYFTQNHVSAYRKSNERVGSSMIISTSYKAC